MDKETGEVFVNEGEIITEEVVWKYVIGLAIMIGDFIYAFGGIKHISLYFANLSVSFSRSLVKYS